MEPDSNKPLIIHSCDDHQIVSQGLKAVLCTLPFIEFSSSATPEELIQFLENNTTDVLILDINVSNTNMLSNIPEIKSMQPSMKIVLFTNYCSNQIIKEVVKHKIDGFMEKNASDDEIIDCITNIKVGKPHLPIQNKNQKIIRDNFELAKELTSRELEVLKLLIAGKTNKLISDELFISILTVQTHRKRIYQKLQIKGVNELIAFANQNDIS